jgi:hypothetical protein
MISSSRSHSGLRIPASPMSKPIRRLSERIACTAAKPRQALYAACERKHAAGDAVARQHGWTITTTENTPGFSGRCYHDPRFDQLGQPTGPAAGFRDRPERVTGQ